MKLNQINVEDDKKNRPTIVCATDEKYAIPTMTMIKSIEYNSKESVNVIVLDGGINSNTKKRFLKNFADTSIDIIMYTIDNSIFPNLKTSERMPIVTYYRLLIPEILYQFEKVIYLDSDIIVLGDINKLFEMELGNKALGAVHEMNKKAMYVSLMWGIKPCRELGIPLKSHYFNAGVLLLNLKKWRDENISKRIFDYFQKYEKYVYFHDQDGLNAVLWNDWAELPPVWNVMTAFYEAKDWTESTFDQNEYRYVRENVELIHYINCTMWKPWMDKSTHPRKEEYNKYNGHLV